MFRNEDYQYEFSYPPTAKIITEDVNSFPTDEQSPNLSFEEYIAQLQETYPGAFCVSLIHNIGFINISAPPNETSKYTLCGGFGVGDYDITPVVETVFVGDTSHSSKGYQIHERDAQATLRDEFYFVELENGTNISYGGSWLDQGATYEEYLELKEDLLRILASYETLVPWGNENIPTRTPGPTPTALFLQSGDDEAACIKPEGLPGEIAVIYYPFCIFWAESLEDEKGFEIVIEYADVEKLYELFVFQTGLNATSLLIPEEYAPRLGESREQCLRRKSFVLKLYTLQEDEKKYFTELAQESECNLPNLPTATPEP